MRERVALVRGVCAAVQCAHQHLVVHRDLKPGNILVTHDGQPKPGPSAGRFYWATNLREYSRALDSFRRGSALLVAPADWPAALRAERAESQTGLLSYQAKTLGVVGDVVAGIDAIREAQRWHRIYLQEFEALHPGKPAPSAWVPAELYLDEADLWLRAGNLAEDLRALEGMRNAIGRWDDPAHNPMGKGTYFSRRGHAQHVLAASMHSRLADAVAARALLEASLASQQQGHQHRKRTWDAEPDSYPARSLTAQCLLLMGNAAFEPVAHGGGPTLDRRGYPAHHARLGCRLGTPVARAGMVAEGRGPAALPHLDAARELEARETREGFPSDRLAALYQDTGDAQWLAGNRAASEQAYRSALGMWERLTLARPTYGEHASNLVCAVTRFASQLVKAGRREDARVETRRVMQLLRGQTESPGAASSRLTEYAWLLLTAQPADLRDPGAALLHAQRAVDMPHGDHPDALGVLAVAQFLNGATEQAVATALRIYDLVPEMRAGRDAATLRRDILENLRRHPLQPPTQPLWF